MTDDEREELRRLRQLEFKVVTALVHRLDDSDDRSAEELVELAAKALDAANPSKAVVYEHTIDLLGRDD